MKTKRTNRATPLICLLMLGIFSAQAQADEVLMAYPQDGSVGLAMGWDMEKNTAVPNICIKNYKQYSTSKNDLTQGFRQGNNSFSLQESLDVSYKERVKAAESLGAGVSEKASGSQSAEVKLAANFDMAKDNRYIVASQNFVTKWQALQSDGGVIERSDEAKAWTSDEFAKNCGSGYVARIEYGGEFHALFNMHTTGYTAAATFQASLQQKSSAKESAPGETGSDSEESQAGMAADSSISTLSSNVSIHVHESGATPVSAGTDVDSVLSQYASFATRVTDDTATEFMLAVVPYPDPVADGTQAAPSIEDLQLPYVVLGREFSKWSYLDSLLNKIIASSTQQTKAYVSIPGVTLSEQDLENMQDMTNAKVVAIQKQIDTCMAYVNGSSIDTDGLQTNCSLSGQQVDFTTTQDGKPKTSKVDIEESDVYYLVRLPFSTSIYDGQIASSSASNNKLTYQDIITNQVNGVYSERCGGSIVNIANYCEDASNVARAVQQYVGDAVGQMYYKYQSFGGTKNALCMSFENGDSGTYMSNEDCTTAALLGFDAEHKQVKVRVVGDAGIAASKPMCIRSTEPSSGYGSGDSYEHFLSLTDCTDAIAKSQADDLVYWQPTTLANPLPDSKKVVVTLDDANYDIEATSNTNGNCATVYKSRSPAGTEIVNQSCSSKAVEQQWLQILGQFYLEEPLN